MPHRIRLAGYGIGAAALALLTGCASSTQAAAPRTSSSSTAAAAPASSDRSDASQLGSGFRLRLELPATTFPADGQPIHAHVVVSNLSGRSVVIHDACNGWIGVGLVAPHVEFSLTNGDVGCASKRIRPGVQRITVTISTTYDACQQGRRRGTPDMPHCQGASDSTIPNLPPGKYLTKIETMSLSRSPLLPEPQVITLTTPR